MAGRDSTFEPLHQLEALAVLEAVNTEVGSVGGENVPDPGTVREPDQRRVREIDVAVSILPDNRADLAISDGRKLERLQSRRLSQVEKLDLRCGIQEEAGFDHDWGYGDERPGFAQKESPRLDVERIGFASQGDEETGVNYDASHFAPITLRLLPFFPRKCSRSSRPLCRAMSSVGSASVCGPTRSLPKS